MPANNPLGYLPPDVQLALLGGIMPGIGISGAGLGQMLALSLQGAAPAPPTVSQRTAPRAAPRPRLTQGDLDALAQMDYGTLIATRKKLKNAGLLTPEVDTHFSRRLQTINTQRR